METKPSKIPGAIVVVFLLLTLAALIFFCYKVFTLGGDSKEFAVGVRALAHLIGLLILGFTGFAGIQIYLQNSLWLKTPDPKKIFHFEWGKLKIDSSALGITLLIISCVMMRILLVDAQIIVGPENGKSVFPGDKKPGAIKISSTKVIKLIDTASELDQGDFSMMMAKLKKAADELGDIDLDDKSITENDDVREHLALFILRIRFLITYNPEKNDGRVTKIISMAKSLK